MTSLAPANFAATLQRENRLERRNFLKGMAFISPWLIGFLVFTLIPVVLSLYYSFCTYTLITPPIFRGLENFRALFADPLFWLTLGVTFKYGAIALPAAMLVSLGLAVMLNSNIKGQSVYRTIIFLPSLVPLVASAMVWMCLLNTKNGIFNAAISDLGNLIGRIIRKPISWHGVGWLTDPSWALPTLALMSLWGVGNTVVIYLAGLQEVPRDLYEAAEIDGAGRFRRLVSVTIPMISPVIFFNLVMAIINTLQVFVMPYIMTKGGPDRRTTFYTMYLYDNAFTYLKMGYASAMAWVQLLIILALTALAFWTGKRWVYYQGK
jgi:multiple sugar transport system permease protein